jgi:hypothetical protein
MRTQTSTAIALARKSLGVVLRERGLRAILLAMVGGYLGIALLMLILISGLRVFVNIGDGARLTFGQQFGILLILLVFYIVNYLVSSVSNAAISGASILLLTDADAAAGTANTSSAQLARDGFRLAVVRIIFLVGYAALSATLGVAARLILRFSPRSKTPNVGISVIGSLVGTAIASTWDIIPYLIFPVILAEGRGLFNSMRLSGQLYADAIATEPAEGASQLNIIFIVIAALGFIPGCLLVLVGIGLRSNLLSTLGFIGLFMLIGLLTIAAGAANALINTSLYLYIKSDNPGPIFSSDELRAVFNNPTP